MKNRVLLPLATVLMLGGAAAFATPSNNTIDGTIKTLDLAKHELMLTDGSSYTLPEGFDAAGLKAGVKVVVEWQPQGDIHEVIKVEPYK